MAKRVFEIAKELKVASKAVVKKCHDEGIPDTLIKNHMSTVSAGLEQTIREWFSESESAHTAVENTEKVDLESVRVAPKQRRGAKAVESDEDATDTDSGGVATAAPAAAAAAPTSAPAPTIAPAPTKARPIPTQVAATPAPAEPDDSAQTSAPQPAASTPATAESKDTTTPAETDISEATPSPQAATPQAASPPAVSPTIVAASSSSGTTQGAAPVAPAPQNVPSRPTEIKPAGPQLDVRKPVKLSGPKVVRVEAPDNLPAPRSSRPYDGGGNFSGQGPGGGGGGGAGAGPARRGGPARRRGGPGGQGGPGGGASTRRRTGAGEEAAPGSFTVQDLAEREARLQRSGGYLKMRRQQAKRAAQAERSMMPSVQGGTVKISEPFTIKDLSAATGVKAADIVKKLFMQGIMATINSGIETSQAQEAMMDWDIELEVVEAKTAEQQISEAFEKRDTVDERPRGPVVTIMGHVDHGKTSLLDKIRNARVAAGEAGGITQATSAFRVPVTMGDDTKQVVFVDTPGHQAFTEMRSRGATITDVVVLVVAADDGVMPQTIESINHAKAAGVPIVVALNKCDKPEATDTNVQRIYGQLAEHGLNPTEWGGDVEVIKTSAITGDGIQELLDVLDYQAQLLELKADFGGAAGGSVIEARMVEGRGPVASLLVQQGKLKVGDFLVAGPAFGRVRDIINDQGKRLKEVEPPIPVQVSGLDQIPDAGDPFFVVDTLKKAQQAAEQRRHRDREQQLAQPAVTLSSLFTQMGENEPKEILIVLKADVQGSVDVLRSEIESNTTDEVKVRVLHAAVGGITDSDVVLAEASNAIIVGFNVIPAAKARSTAEQKKVEIRTYDVIYHITEDIKKAVEGMLEPELRQEVLGHAEVRKVFRVSKVGMIAGCYVTDGTIERDALIRVTRGDIVIENDRKLAQLKRIKDDAKEVRSGMECGMKIDGYDDIKEGDILECYKTIEVKRTL
ncbi:MAG: translation initiation factor IF-2 [Planctomycetota bacterium]|nr:translation initiation factor IF-2 [Planctomycetota bacterium]